jgi:hypoxanthine phosphoribosyltransferase
MILFTEKEIQNKVGEIAYNLKKRHHDQPPVFICVLNGAFMFFTDLVKHMEDCHIDFIRAKSYEGTSQGEIYITKQIEIDVTGKDVYLIDDIYDSGNTMNRLIKNISYGNPKSITPVTLFKRHTSKNPDLIYGFDLENEYFLSGYGLDGENDLKRNQKYITGIMSED